MWYTHQKAHTNRSSRTSNESRERKKLNIENRKPEKIKGKNWKRMPGWIDKRVGKFLYRSFSILATIRRMYLWDGRRWCSALIILSKLEKTRKKLFFFAPNARICVTKCYDFLGWYWQASNAQKMLCSREKTLTPVKICKIYTIISIIIKKNNRKPPNQRAKNFCLVHSYVVRLELNVSPLSYRFDSESCENWKQNTIFTKHTQCYTHILHNCKMFQLFFGFFC